MKLVGVFLVLAAIVFTAFNVFGDTMVTAGLGALSTSATRWLVYVNIAALYFSLALLLPVASWVRVTRLRMSLTKGVLIVAVLGVCGVVALYAIAGTPDPDRLRGSSDMQALLIIISTAIFALGAPLTTIVDLVSKERRD